MVLAFRIFRAAVHICLCVAICSTAVKASNLLDDLVISECDPSGPALVIYIANKTDVETVACGAVAPGGRKVTTEDRFLLASVSKLYLTVSIMQQVEQGKLATTDLAADLLPEDIVANLGGLEGITLDHLMRMRSGLPDYLDDQFPDDHLEMIAQGKSHRDVIRHAMSLIEGRGTTFEPGASFEYSNTNYLLLQLILEGITGQTMSDYFQEHLFKPAGIEHTDLLGYGVTPAEMVEGQEDLGTGNGIESVARYHAVYGLGDGALVATAEDVALFYRALFRDFLLLSRQSVERMLKDPYADLYGMGVEVEKVDDTLLVVGHSGEHIGFSSDVRYALDEDVIVVALQARAGSDLAFTIDIIVDEIE
ncbi:MAG: beta-lactamase family protein [Rhodobacteraceae bacterium]|nr:beta-lactamase family protein [Paracoccaceae bacterium]